MSEFTVRLTGDDRLIHCRGDQSVLDACLRAGVSASYNCRSGECGECIAQLIEGSVHELPGADPAIFNDRHRAQGKVLTCICYPRSDLSLTINVRSESDPAIGETSAVIVDVQRHGSSIVEVALETRGVIDYRAGQYFEWMLPGIANNRSYSVANRPGTNRLEFHLRLYECGQVSRLFTTGTLTVGSQLRLYGPFGTFGLTADDHRPAILIAGSTGLAPIIAMIEEARARHSSRQYRFFYGARTAGDLYKHALLTNWAATSANFSYIPALSDEPSDSAWTGARGLVTSVVEAQVGDLFGAEAFLCGPPPMIDAAIEILKRKGMLGADIHYDKFTAS